jgi:hypothetical protein
LQIYQIFIKEKLHFTRQLFNKINEERKIEEKNNSTKKHQTTFRNSLKGKIQYRENIKSSLTTIQHPNVKTFSPKEGQMSQQCSSNKAPITRPENLSTIEVRQQ